MSDLDLKTKNIMGIFANIIEKLPQEELNELIQSGLQSGIQDLSITNHAKAIHPSKNQWGQIYKDDYVVMQNRMLHAISHLTLNERRLVLMLATIVRGAVELNPAQKIFTINAEDFGEMFDLNRKKQYEILQEVSKSLHGKVFYYWDFDSNDKQAVVTKKGKRIESGVSWIGKAVYRHGEGRVDLLLIDDVIEMLCIFDQHNAFTKHKKEWISKLGAYGIVLLQQIIVADHAENVYKNKEGMLDPYLRTVSYTIEFLRHKLDCLERYLTFADFKRYVIDKAVKDIHEHTPYQVSYQKITKGRVVTGIQFIFKNTENFEPKKIESESDIWLNFKMSEKQLRMFGDKIATICNQDPEKIGRHLADVCHQDKYIEQLKELGFKPSAWYDPEEVAMMHAAYQQRKALKQYEIAKQKEIEEAKKQAMERAERERQQKLAQMGWFDAVVKFDAMGDDEQMKVMQSYFERLDVNTAKIARSKLGLAKKLNISITATAIDEHGLFIESVNLF